MKLETLRKDWQEAHPGGNVWISLSNGQLLEGGKQTGKFAVTYNADGKIYTYAYKSVYSLAERLNMIPSGDIDYWVESRKAIAALRRGETFDTLGGLMDTMRHLLFQETGKGFSIRYTSNTRDEYDRVIFHIYGMEEVVYA
jgi:hypothetical protein